MNPTAPSTVLGPQKLLNKVHNKVDFIFKARTLKEVIWMACEKLKCTSKVMEEEKRSHKEEKEYEFSESRRTWFCVVYFYPAAISITDIRTTSYHRSPQPFLDNRKGEQPPLLAAGGGTRYKIVKKRKEKRLGQGDRANRL